MDFFETNNCCSDSAVFSPNHRISIYILIACLGVVIICLIFYDKLRTYGLIAFHLLYQTVYNRDFDEMRVERNKTKKKNVNFGLGLYVFDKIYKTYKIK